MTEILNIEATLTWAGVNLPLDSANISADEDSVYWTFSASLLDPADYLMVSPSGHFEVALTVRGVVFGFLVEGAERSRQRGGGSTFTLSGRSPTALLSERHAVALTADFGDTTAQAIATQLCSSAGIVLLWQTVDWPLKAGVMGAVGKYPMQIIQQLAEVVGAVVQTSADGYTLIVRPRHPVSPPKYDSATISASLSDANDFLSLSETWESRPGYDRVTVGFPDPVTDENPIRDAVQIMEDRRPDGIYLRVYITPWRDERPGLLDSAGSHASAIYQGVHSETVQDDVEIVDGNGRTSKQCRSVTSFEYLFDDLGTVKVSQGGDVTAAIIGNSVARIAYSSQFHLFRVEHQDDAELAQFYVYADNHH